MVELVIVILLVGIMAVFIAPRLQTTRIDELGFYHDTLAAIRYAHKVAVTSGCSVSVSVAATGVTLVLAGVPAACGAAAVPNPANNTPFVTQAPSGVSVAGATFQYDAIGDPSVGQDIVITNSDGSTRVIRIVDETGFAFTP